MLAALKILRAYTFALGTRVRSVGAVTRYTGIRTRFQRKRFFLLRSVQPSCRSWVFLCKHNGRPKRKIWT